MLSNVGRLREALSFQLVAHATDEWGAPKTAQLARAYANMGNLPAARGWLQKGVQLWPNHSGVRRVQQYITGFYEPPADAIATIDRLDAQSSSNDNETTIWRIFIEARAAHSRRVPAAIIQEIREAPIREKITPENEIMMLAALGETRQAIEVANLALDHQQQLEPMVPVHAGHAQCASGSGLRPPGRAHGPDRILARDGQKARLLHRSGNPKRMQSPTAGRAEIELGFKTPRTGWQKRIGRADHTIRDRYCR